MENSGQDQPNAENQLKSQLENLQITELPPEVSLEQPSGNEDVAAEAEVDSDDYDSNWETSDDEDETILQLKIVLKGVNPKIWRRIQVQSGDTFEDLHQYIQEAMGWRECHLHQFEMSDGTLVVTQAMADFNNESEAVLETEMEIGNYFTEVGDKAVYVYDMGDWWVHDIVLEKILQGDPNVFYPKCVGGKRACPPEDCGGSEGYKHLLKVIADPSHKEHDDLTTWLEEFYPGFNPEKFNKKDVFNTLYLDLEKFENFLNGPN